MNRPTNHQARSNPRLTFLGVKHPKKTIDYRAIGQYNGSIGGKGNEGDYGWLLVWRVDRVGNLRACAGTDPSGYRRRSWAGCAVP